MAKKQKVLVDDTGSAVLAEVVAQVNQSFSYNVGPALTEAAGVGGAAFVVIIASADKGFWIDDVAIACAAGMLNAATDIFIEYDDDYAFGAAINILGREGFNATAWAANEFGSLFEYGATSDTGALPAWVPAGQMVRMRIINTEGVSVTVLPFVKIRPAEYELDIRPPWSNKLRAFAVKD